MKALTFENYGKSPEIAITHVPIPAIKPDELLVEVHAAGLNPIDNMITTGAFKTVVKLQLPAIMGSDLAGVVIQVGSAVTRFKEGDAVFASLFELGGGAIAEFAAVPEHAAARKPANLDFVQAASIPMVGLTSWQAFKERASLQSGQKVFIPAGAGGIGTFAIQLAKHLGAEVATTTSTGNMALVRSLGADEVVNYQEQAFEQLLHDVDLVLGTTRGERPCKSCRHPQARRQDRITGRSAGCVIRQGSADECVLHLRIRVDEPQDHASGQKEECVVLVSVCSRGWRSTWRDCQVA